MKKISANLRFIFLTAMMLTAACVALITVSLFVSYNPETNYFGKSLVYSVAKALIVLTVIGTAFYISTLPKDELSGDSPTTLPVSIISALPAISLLTMSAVIFSGSFNSSVLTFVCGACAVISSVYFIFNSIFADSKNSVKVYLGCFVPFTGILIIATTYFDMSVSMNAPAKVFLYIALISFSLWSLLELRTMTEKRYPRMYFALGLITVTLTASASIPWIIAMSVGKLGKPIYPSYIIFNVIAFALSVYVLVRMIVFLSARSLIERLSEQTYSDNDIKSSGEDKKSEEV